MKAKPKITDQGDLFRNRLENILDRKHPLFKLADSIDWSFFERVLGWFYVESQSRPALPIRLLVELYYLKSAHDVSDEGVVAAFQENPCWQYLLGYEFFQHVFPLDPSSLTRWRHRVGVEGVELLLLEILETARRLKLLKAHVLKWVTVDTPVQEQAVRLPAESRLYQKARELLVTKARAYGIKLPQSYVRKEKQSLVAQSPYARAGQFKRARRQAKSLKIYWGRVLRDVERKLGKQRNEVWTELLSRCQRVYERKRTNKDKLYRLHGPEIECISKGKAHKRYEFGVKVRVVRATRDNWVLGTQALHGNLYDGHTLQAAIPRAQILPDNVSETIFYDGFAWVMMPVVLRKSTWRVRSEAREILRSG